MTGRAAFRGVLVDGLRVRFGAVEAVTGVDLRVEQGQVLGLLGRTGAGKSTTMRVLAGVVPPSEGTALVGGYDVREATIETRRAIGYCPDGDGLVPDATPWEHLQTSARLRELSRWEARGRALLERFDLGSVAHRATEGFGPSLSRRLRVVLAALHEPEVLLLDEPFDGVDPVGVAATLEVVEEARTRGAAVLVSTRLRDLAVETCSEVAVLRGGSRMMTISAGFMAGDDGARVYRALLAG